MDKEENGFIVLEVLHQYVELLDRYFGNVCELDLIFNFHKAYNILDELLIGGYVHEPSNFMNTNVEHRQKAIAQNSGSTR